MISLRQIISESAGPIFAIFTPNQSVLGADDQSGPFFSISQGTLPWQPIQCRTGLVRSEPKYLRIRWTDFQSLHRMIGIELQMINLTFFF